MLKMKLKIKQKVYPRRNISDGPFSGQTGIDLIYEYTTIFDCGLSLDFLEHDCTFHPAFPWPPLKAIIFFWIANVNLRRPYDDNNPGHSLFECLAGGSLTRAASSWRMLPSQPRASARSRASACGGEPSTTGDLARDFFRSVAGVVFKRCQ
jgi:hypothetical protein